MHLGTVKKAVYLIECCPAMVSHILSLHCRINTMTDELLSLKWNNHKSTFADILTILRDQVSLLNFPFNPIIFIIF